MPKSIKIDKDVLGLQHHVSLKDDGSVSLVEHLDDNSWIWSDKPVNYDLKSLVSATDSKIRSSPPTSHTSAWKFLEQTPNWSMSLPRHVFKKWLQDFTSDLQIVVNKWDDSYYGKEFQIQQRLLQKLRQPFVDDHEIKTIDDDRLANFLSNGDGLARHSVYDNTSSVTGRMSIINGPNILTLDKQYRRVFKSRFKDGKIIQVDFTSLEPCVCLATQGKKFSNDAYQWVKEEAGLTTERDIIKVATMSALYGMTPSRFAKKFSDVPDAADLLFKVRDAFGVDDLDRRLKQTLLNTSNITNFYGRILRADKTSPVVAYYVQSTAVDVVCQGFLKLINNIQEREIDAVPLYLIHDALMLDVSIVAEKQIADLCKNGIHIPSLDCTFPVKIKTIDA